MQGGSGYGRSAIRYRKNYVWPKSAKGRFRRMIGRYDIRVGPLWNHATIALCPNESSRLLVRRYTPHDLDSFTEHFGWRVVCAQHLSQGLMVSLREGTRVSSRR